MRARRAGIDLDLGELPQLPRNWRWGRLKDVASDERNAIVDGPFGSNLKLSDYIEPPGVPVLTTANLRGDYSPGSVRYISQTKFEELRRSEVRGGDILVAKIGSCGLTGVYPEEMPSAIIPANLLKMTVRAETSKRFVLHYLNSPTFSRFLKAIITATAQPAFNVSKFRQLPIPLPPKAAQLEIVDEIEKHLTRLDAGVAALRRVQANLKRYRAAVLKAACEGRLVPTEAELARKEGRTFETGADLLARVLKARPESPRGRGHYREPQPPAVSKHGVLPDGWTWATFEQIAERVTVGFVGSMKQEYVPEGVPFLRGQNVRENHFDPEGLLHVSPEFHEKLSKSALQPGDLAVVRSGSIGVTCVIPDSLPEANCSDLVLIQRPLGFVPQYGAYYMNSLAKRHVAAGKVGVALTHFNTRSVAELALPLPPLAEQVRIVAEAARRLSVMDALDAVVSASLERATRLRQAILKRAFSEGTAA